MPKSPYPFHIWEHFGDTLKGYNRSFPGSVDLDLNQSRITSKILTFIVLQGAAMRAGEYPASVVKDL